MIYANAINIIEAEWSPEDGFFWNLRHGRFMVEEFNLTLKKLSAVSIADDAKIPRRLVSLLWYIPLFMQWQNDRVQESGGDMTAYVKAITSMTNEIERLLGVP